MIQIWKLSYIGYISLYGILCLDALNHFLWENIHAQAAVLAYHNNSTMGGPVESPLLRYLPCKNLISYRYQVIKKTGGKWHVLVFRVKEG